VGSAYFIVLLHYNYKMCILVMPKERLCALLKRYVRVFAFQVFDLCDHRSLLSGEIRATGRDEQSDCVSSL